MGFMEAGDHLGRHAADVGKGAGRLSALQLHPGPGLKPDVVGAL
jgi:hypothetical protein